MKASRSKIAMGWGSLVFFLVATSGAWAEGPEGSCTGQSNAKLSQTKPLETVEGQPTSSEGSSETAISAK
ncbi:MAG: hypothetical protein RJB38_2425, partial [Pseudomonadota bacterium]